MDSDDTKVIRPASFSPPQIKRPGGGTGGGDGTDEINRRLSSLEQDVKEITATLGTILQTQIEIKATLPHLATTAQVESVRGQLETQLMERPTRTELWAMVGAMVAAFAAAAALTVAAVAVFI